MLPEKIFRKLVQILGIVFIAYIFLQGLFTLCCLRMYTEAPDYIGNRWWTQVFGILAFLGVTHIAMRVPVKRVTERYGEKLFWILLALMSLFLLWWVFNTQFVYCNDLKDIYNCAEKLLAGDYSPWQKGGLAYMWPHQDATVLLVAGMLKFLTVEQSFFWMYMISILAWAATIAFLYLSLGLLNEDRAVVNIQGIMLACYLPYAFLLMQMYNDHLGYALAVGGIYFAVKYSKVHQLRYLVFMTLFLILGIWFKQNSMIILIGIAIFLFFDSLDCGREADENDGKGHISIKNIKRLALSAAAVAIVWLSGSLPTRCVSAITGLEPSGGNSKWAHIAMGMTECINHAPGWFDGDNIILFCENGYDTGRTAQAAKAVVRDALGQFAGKPEYALWFFGAKLATEWNNPTFECFSTQSSKETPLELSGLVKSTINDGGKVNMLFLWFWDIGQSVILFGVLLYFVHIREESMGELLPGILFVGAFIFFMFWETKPRYVALYFFMLIPYAFQGYQTCLLRWKERRTIVALTAMIALVLLLAVVDSGPLALCFKINGDTESYYEYIHENHNNFLSLRY